MSEHVKFHLEKSKEGIDLSELARGWNAELRRRREGQ